jgi:hypothetical protein
LSRETLVLFPYMYGARGKRGEKGQSI